MCPHCLLPSKINLEIYHLLRQQKQEKGGLTVAVTASVLLPLRSQQAEALGEMAEATTSLGSLGSSWTWSLPRGSTPSPPKCGREKKASQREILPCKPASSSGGNPQQHRLRRRPSVQPARQASSGARWLAAGGRRAGRGGTLPQVLGPKRSPASPPPGPVWLGLAPGARGSGPTCAPPQPPARSLGPSGPRWPVEERRLQPPGQRLRGAARRSPVGVSGKDAASLISAGKLFL